jgi:hypothetical protein
VALKGCGRVREYPQSSISRRRPRRDRLAGDRQNVGNEFGALASGLLVCAASYSLTPAANGIEKRVGKLNPGETAISAFL